MAEDPQRQAGSSGSQGASPPRGFALVYRGEPLPPFYAAELLRPLTGRTVWILDAGGRTRNGRLLTVPWVKEDQTDGVAPVVFEDDRPFYLKQVVCVAVYSGGRDGVSAERG